MELVTASETNKPLVLEKLARLLVDYDMEVIIDFFARLVRGKKNRVRPVEDGLGCVRREEAKKATVSGFHYWLLSLSLLTSGNLTLLI